MIGYAFDTADRLSTVTYPDGRSRIFHYEDAGFPQALTGISDETGARWGTFGYDIWGRAISTQLAGGVSRYLVSYPSNNSAGIIDPLNTNRAYYYATDKDHLAVRSASHPSGEGKADAASRTQDANGLVTRETDFGA